MTRGSLCQLVIVTYDNYIFYSLLCTLCQETKRKCEVIFNHLLGHTNFQLTDNSKCIVAVTFVSDHLKSDGGNICEFLENLK